DSRDRPRRSPGPDPRCRRPPRAGPAPSGGAPAAAGSLHSPSRRRGCAAAGARLLGRAGVGRAVIIGTAGHVGRGKSALVSALTGKTMDRLAEEKRRGITIELNFAPLLFEGLPPAGIVDVPGHEDFVRTMVAGASGVELVLLVVDAAEGLRPQTHEHLAIVEQLRVPRGIPVITKADLADPDWIALVAAELEERLARSPVRFEAPAVVSA